MIRNVEAVALTFNDPADDAFISNLNQHPV